MKTFSSEYYYLATGMEGIPYQKDLGIITADSKEKALQKLLEQEAGEFDTNSESGISFLKSCLYVKEI